MSGRCVQCFMIRSTETIKSRQFLTPPPKELKPTEKNAFVIMHEDLGTIAVKEFDSSENAFM